MPLGGGIWLTQNKRLPGSYINFISAARASASLSDRGYVAIPMALDWGPETEVITLEGADLQKDSFIGYAYTDWELQPLREIFKGAKTVYLYRINSGGVKATATSGNMTATAKYCGPRGNDIKVVIETNVDDAAKFDVHTYVGTKKVDTQIAAVVADLVANNFVTFSGEGALAATAGVSLVGGTNGTVDGDSYSAFLDAPAWMWSVHYCLPVSCSSNPPMTAAGAPWSTASR